MREVLERSLGSPDNFAWVYSRAAVMEIAREAGVMCPPTAVVRSEGDISAWFDRHPGPAVLKTDGSWGGRGVAILHTQEEGRVAWREMHRRPPLIRTNRVEALPHEVVDGNRASGSCESVALTGGNFIHATGWAVLNAKGRPADSVAVAYQTAPGQEWTLCAISDSFAMRPEIVKRLGTMEQLWSGWSATFPQTLVPAGAKLSFWAIDADEPRLYQLKDESSTTAR